MEVPHIVVLLAAMFVVPQLMQWMPDFDPLLVIVCVMGTLALVQHLGFKIDGQSGDTAHNENGHRARRSSNNRAADEPAQEVTSSDVLKEAEKCLSQNSWGKAEQLAKQVIDSDPENAKAWELLASAQKWAGNPTQAAATLKKARDIYEVDSPGLKKFAKELESSSASPAETARECEAKGEGFFEKRQYDLASECYAKALEALESAIDAEGLADLRLQVLRRQAECAQQLHDWSVCRRAASAVLEAAPNDTKALLQRAAANEALENFKAALDDARKLRSLDPKSAAANRIANNCQQALRS